MIIEQFKNGSEAVILMVYTGTILLVYGIYNLVAFVLYFPMLTYRKNIYGFWKAICLELAIYTVQKFSLVEFSSKSLKKLLRLNKEKKKEIVWLLEKCIGSIGVFCLCSPLLLVQSKVFLQCLGAGLFIVWHELLLYCVKSMGDKRILQRELPFFLLLSWKYSLEERNKSDYLAASQMVVSEDILKERWELLKKEYAEYPNNELSHRFADTTIDAPEIYYQERFEFFQRKRSIQIESGIKKRYICRMMISFIAICSFCISVFWNLKSVLAI